MSGSSLREACGVFGVWGHPGAARLAYYGLFALQHRGQESAGIVVSDGMSVHAHKGMGLVSEVFSDDSVDELTGDLAIGHVRYSTTGSSNLANAQPILIRYRGGSLALAHNGNLVNAGALRSELEGLGSIFQTTVDTEVIAHVVARSRRETLVENLIEALSVVQGGYALVVMNRDTLIAARDPNGFRPLSLGRYPGAASGAAVGAERFGQPGGPGAWVVASETCALDATGAEFVREVQPGELLVVDRDGLRSMQAVPAGQPALCVFEYIYFARPDSNLEGRNVHAVRKALGARLAKDFPVQADIVTGVPDSSISAATGFAEAAGLPLEMGLVKNRYIGRTFIQPSTTARSFGVQVKLNPLRKVLEGRRVVLVDDSIVRGTTSKRIVGLLRQAGAVEVHMRISSPPYRHSCYYGIDTSAVGELIAVGRTLEEIQEAIGADSLAYLTPQAMHETVTGLPDWPIAERCCMACFTGRYAVEVAGAGGKFGLEDAAPACLAGLDEVAAARDEVPGRPGPEGAVQQDEPRSPVGAPHLP